MHVEQEIASPGPRSQVMARDPATLPARNAEVTFTREDLEAYPRIADEIHFAECAIWRTYDEADRKANGRQRRHEMLTLLAATGGTAAILLSLFELSGLPASLPGGGLPGWVEPTMLFVAIVSIGFGLIAAYAPGWLLERHKAESCRLLQFQFLIDPDLWSGDPARRDARMVKLTRDVEAICAADQEQLKAWIETEAVCSPPTGWSEKMLSDGTLHELVAFYRNYRLASQMAFFKARKESLGRREALLKALPTVLFAASVLLAVASLAYVNAVNFGYVHANLGLVPTTAHVPAEDDDHGTAHELDTLSRMLVVGSAALGIVAAAVRTVRGAHEYGRNSSRYAAKYELLSGLEEKLKAGPIGISVLGDFWYAEQSLEADHRDWLRLMSQAEWFG
jgi:hypothetical protein